MKISVKVPAGKRLVVSETSQEVSAVFESKETNTSEKDSAPIQITVKVPAGKQFVVEHSTAKNNEETVNQSKLPQNEKGKHTVERWGTCATTTVQKPPSDVMQIFVKNLTGKLNTYSVRPTDTVQSLKKKVQEKEGVPSRLHRLIFSGQNLDDGCILQNYGIKSGNTVFMVLRLLSCQNCPGCKH